MKKRETKPFVTKLNEKLKKKFIVKKINKEKK